MGTVAGTMGTVVGTRLLGVLAMLVLLVGASVADGASPAVAQTDPVSVLEEATVAVNSGDLDGFMSFWADDGVFRNDPCFAVFGPGGCVGKAQIRAVSALFIEDAFNWTWTQEFVVSGNTVSSSAELRVGALAALDIERVVFSATAWDVVDGKFTLVEFETDLTDPDSVSWQNAVFASVGGMQMPNTGTGGLAATNGGGGLSTLPWQLALGAAVLTLLLSARVLAARRSAAWSSRRS